MTDISEHAITTVDQAKDAVHSFVSEVNMLVTYDEVNRALYEKRNITEAAAFLITHGGEVKLDDFGQTTTQLHAEYNDRILHAHVTNALKGGAVVDLAEYRTTLFRKRQLAVQSAVLHLGAIGTENKIVDTERHILTPKTLQVRGESTMRDTRRYALTIKNLAELLLFITE